MKVFIVRHGDKEKGAYYNKNLRPQDPPLNKKGNQEAQKLIRYFQHIPIKRIFTSEYLRTTQTAQYIARDKGLQVLKDNRLNEIDNGIIEIMSDKEIEEKYPEFWNDFSTCIKDVRFPEGETGEEVKARQKDLLNELIRNDEDVLLVSHEGYMRLLICHILDIPVYRRKFFKVDMCGIIELEFNQENEEWSVIRFNQTMNYIG
ncbi:MAG TPA: histidine phosphatase family protein [Bacillota bacterium]|nr:histidine phosphatase family protein [Bacillota bacterium]